MNEEEIKKLGEKVARGEATEAEKVEYLKHVNDSLEGVINSIEEATA